MRDRRRKRQREAVTETERTDLILIISGEVSDRKGHRRSCGNTSTLPPKFKTWIICKHAILGCVQCLCDNVKTWVRAIQYVTEYKPVMATVNGKQLALPPSPELGQVDPAVF